MIASNLALKTFLQVFSSFQSRQLVNQAKFLFLGISSWNYSMSMKSLIKMLGLGERITYDMTDTYVHILQSYH